MLNAKTIVIAVLIACTSAFTYISTTQAQATGQPTGIFNVSEATNVKIIDTPTACYWLINAS